jgi:DnaJ family protein A protein 2
MVTRMQ